LSTKSAGRRADVKAAARIAAIGAALYGGVHVIGALLQATPLAALVAQAVGAEWGGGRLGISWSNPLAPALTSKEIGRRIAKGAMLGLVASGALVELLQITHTATFARTSFVLSALFTGLLAAILMAVRDQLLFSGLPLRVLNKTDAPIPKILACGAAAAAHAYVAPDATLHEVAAGGAFGLFSGALWLHEGGAFRAVAMNAAWLFAAQVLFRGTFVDVIAGPTAFAGGDAGITGGWAATVVLVIAAAIATAMLIRKPTESSREQTK
jgi:hypothetical protein